MEIARDGTGLYLVVPKTRRSAMAGHVEMVVVGGHLVIAGTTF